jgi:hypothetical protein
VTIRKFTTAHYAAIVSTAAFFISAASFYVSKVSNDFNVAKWSRPERGWNSIRRIPGDIRLSFQAARSTG